MTRRFLRLIIPFALAVHCVSAVGGSSISGQEARSALCGRVVSVSCWGPSSAVTLQLARPRGSPDWRVVIPPEYRRLFDTRIEDRYDEQLVCVAPGAAATASRMLKK